MSTADSVQVGGVHYKTTFQHWNLAAECQMGYWEGQITKYLSRHTQKNGLQDVEKSEHFLTKLIELSRNGYPAMNAEAKTATVHRYFSANQHIGPLEQKVIMAVCFWSRTKHIEPALAIIHQIKQGYADADAARKAGQDGAAGPSYVNQDQHEAYNRPYKAEGQQ